MNPDEPRCNPALVSDIARGFKAAIVPGTRRQVDVVYDNVFTGREAIDALCALLQIADRKRAVLVAREMEDQGLFRDFNHVHRLRDDPSKLYCFIPHASAHAAGGEADAKPQTPSGVYTLLTRCYSPTCGLGDPSEGCYSPLCPTFPHATNEDEVGGHSTSTSESGDYGGYGWTESEGSWGEAVAAARGSVRGCCYSAACTAGGYCYSPTCIKVLSTNATLGHAGAVHLSESTQPDHGSVSSQ
jgi:hypothetical protein